MTETTKRKPTHFIYDVIDLGEGKTPFWKNIGAAWENADGKGMNLRFDYLPLRDNKNTVIREATYIPEHPVED